MIKESLLPIWRRKQNQQQINTGCRKEELCIKTHPGQTRQHAHQAGRPEEMGRIFGGILESTTITSLYSHPRSRAHAVLWDYNGPSSPNSTIWILPMTSPYFPTTTGKRRTRFTHWLQPQKWEVLTSIKARPRQCA